VVAAVVAAGVWLVSRPKSGAPAAVRTTNPAAAPPPASSVTPAPVAAPALDGTYRFDYTDMDDSMWWGFRSVCTPTGCTATGIILDPYDHRLAASDKKSISRTPIRPVLHWIGDRWDGGYQSDFACSLRADPTDPGIIQLQHRQSLVPEPDGSYRVTDSSTVVSGECRDPVARDATVTYVATRYGPPPLGVVPDPPMPR
jgi:serine/threonine-protein kinase